MDGRFRLMLYSKHANLLTRKLGRVRQITPIQCGPGWFDLIDQFSTTVGATARLTGFSLYLSAIQSHTGTLNIRWEPHHQLAKWETAKVRALVIQYVALSLTVCEVCGGRTEPKGDLFTRCRIHESRQHGS